MSGSQALARRLRGRDAVVLGLASMIGAGVFSVFSPAAATAGSWLLLGLALAAVVAYLNATASAQLAAQYPTSGGTYVYGRERLGAWPGFLAGWAFVIGKTASCAAMALTFAAYAVPPAWARPTAVVAVLAIAALNTRGVTRTAGAARVIVGFVLLVLAVVVAAGASALPAQSEPGLSAHSGWLGVVQSAGLLFFAFAGYARIATMGEEVTDPSRTIPRAILTALAVALAVYLAVGSVALLVLGPARLAAASAPLVAVVQQAGWDWAGPVVRAGAAVASLGALLALMAGVGRTTLAMARHADLPAWLGEIDSRRSVPRHAELVLAVVVSGLVLTVDLRGAIGFSSFGVLLYYAVANLAAFTQTGAHRRSPRWLQVVGVGGCLLLAATLPWQSIAVGLLVLLVGVLYRVVVVTGVGAASTGAPSDPADTAPADDLR